MSFFKAYDMRGTFGTDFDLETVRKIGRQLPEVVKGGRWLIGRDCRVTSSDVRDALVDGLEAAGVEVDDIGLCTTPMVYFFTANDGYDGSVMITASHNPPGDNGLKVSKKTALPVGYANGLKDVEAAIGQGQKTDSKDGGKCSVIDGLPRYLEWMKGKTGDLSGLKIGVDCSNGMSSLIVRDVLPDAVIINDTMDGRFPCHSPNPLKDEAREQIAALVRGRGLDCGVIFDGDADRAMFVDERGEFVQPDYLIPLVAKATIGVKPAKVIHDVRTSRGTIETIREMGCEPVMVPVGHAFAKPILRDIGAVCGGELAGHYYFSEFFGCDSGMLAALRILNEVAAAKRAGRSFSQLMAPIVSRYANSGEINFRVEDKDAAISRVMALVGSGKLPNEVSRSEIDGIRVEFEDGWFNIRKSNTEPYLRLIVEARTPEMLADWKAKFTGAIENAG